MPEMKKILKEGFFYLLVILGIVAYFRRRNRNKITILMYHGVVKLPLKPFCWTQISGRKLEYQLKYLKKHYSILSISDVMDRIRKGLPLPANTAVVTFDDGYRNNFTIAYPLLKRLQIPATIFLVTGCISDRLLCWPDVLYLGIKNTRQQIIDLRQHGLKRYPLRTLEEKETAEQEIVEHLKSILYSKKDAILDEILKLLMVQADTNDPNLDLLTWEEIKAIHDERLIEFGAHTITHNILSQMDDNEIKKEIAESCDTIEKHLGSKCLWFAYPNGRKEDFNHKIMDTLKANGIICGLSTIPGLVDRNEDLFELKRVAVGSDISQARFKCLVSGLLLNLKNLS